MSSSPAPRFFLTSCNCIRSPSRVYNTGTELRLLLLKQSRHFSGSVGVSSLSASLKSAQVAPSKTQTQNTHDNRMLACVVVGSGDGGGRKTASFFMNFWSFFFFPHFDSTSVHTMCHYCSEERRRGSDLDGASKQKQQWFLLSRLLKLTHAPFGRASPGVKSIWRISQTQALPSTL